MRRLLVLLAGCNQVFEIRETAVVDGAVIDAPDGDQDGIADDLDNCRAMTNSSQHDEDQDGVGDVCDNCPIISNTSQADVGDGDGIGDVCDPRPGEAGDCLVLLDTFVDPVAFGSGWRLTTDSPTGMVTPEVERLRLHPSVGQSIALQALDGSGAPFTGVFDVDLVGHAPLATGWLGAAGALDNRTRMFACHLVDGLRIRMDWETTAVITGLSTLGVTDDVLVRFDLTVHPPPDVTKGNCRVDYGVAVAVLADIDIESTPPTGGPGIVAADGPSEVDAIAVYNSITPCPAPVVR